MVLIAFCLSFYMEIVIPLSNVVFETIVIPNGDVFRDSEHDFLVQMCKLTGKLLKVLVLIWILDGLLWY